MISRAEVLMGRDKQHPLTPELEANLEKLLKALNVFRQAYGKPMRVTSGYRPSTFNTKAGGARRSAHMTCEACDFADSDGAIKQWALANLNVLEQTGLYMEHPDATPTWCHLQTRPTRNRVFRP